MPVLGIVRCDGLRGLPDLVPAGSREDAPERVFWPRPGIQELASGQENWRCPGGFRRAPAYAVVPAAEGLACLM